MTNENSKEFYKVIFDIPYLSCYKRPFLIMATVNKQKIVIPVLIKPL